MNISTNHKVNDFLADTRLVSPDKFDMVVSIRELFFKSNKELVEEIKYGGIAFNLSDSLIGGIYVYKEHISIEFSNGAELADDDSLLEGNGKKRRHLKINQLNDIFDKNSEYFIKQACNG